MVNVGVQFLTYLGSTDMMFKLNFAENCRHHKQKNLKQLQNNKILKYPLKHKIFISSKHKRIFTILLQCALREYSILYRDNLIDLVLKQLTEFVVLCVRNNWKVDIETGIRSHTSHQSEMENNDLFSLLPIFLFKTFPIK